jgi:predicted small metal-binding protein
MITVKVKEVKTMAAQEKELSCRDFRQDGGFSAKAKTEKEGLDKCRVHACGAHEQCNDSPEIRGKIRARIRDVL